MKICDLAQYFFAEIFKNEDFVLKFFEKVHIIRLFSGIASSMKMLSKNLRVENVNIYVYIFVYMYISIYINIYIYRRANGIYI